MKETKGITLIALVITIIVLLILAGVTIATLTGDNGLLQKTGEATEKNSIGTEKEQIALAATSVRMNDEEDLAQREEIFQNELNKYAGENKTKVYASSSSYTIHFIETNRVYTIDDNGEIREEDASIVKQDEVAGAFDGTGSENDPYIIMSIEDLVYLANQVNNGTNNYNSKWIELGKTLDFKSKLSYKDKNTKYSYDEARKSYIPNEESENTLMELCTTGEGFLPIVSFCGKFNGNNYEISNLYEKSTKNGGLFDGLRDAIVKNLKVSGNIILEFEGTGSEDAGYAGGIAARCTNTEIYNCVNNVNIKGTGKCGGIAGGKVYANNHVKFTNCINYGEIESTNFVAGGICGYTYTSGSHSIKFINCTNYGNVLGVEAAGGISGGLTDSISICNSSNIGEITVSGKNKYAGGIVGNSGASVKSINNYNKGKIKGTYSGSILGKVGWSTTALINNYYLDNMDKEIGNNNNSNLATKITTEYLNSQDFVDVLNRYIEDNHDTTQEWVKWSLGNEGYPILDYNN